MTLSTAASDIKVVLFHLVAVGLQASLVTNDLSIMVTFTWIVKYSK